MNNKLLMMGLILVTMIVLWTIGKNAINGNNSGSLLNPIGRWVTKSTTPSPTFLPNSTPKTFKFDSSTDLKKELEKVDPKVLDSDFDT